MPDASQHFQELMIVIAVVSILYGSMLAFSQDEARLVVGYSSIAQLGFITLGIFSLDPKGAQGAVFQMVNHGIVTARAVPDHRGAGGARGRSERLSQMGGLAFRAPVLAALFLIVALATLAMPGSGNFVGELYILFGIFESKLAYGIVASLGVALAAVYMIRMYQRSMHNRVGPAVESREMSRWDFGLIAPLVAVIIFLGVYPQFVLRAEREEHRRTASPRDERDRSRSETTGQATHRCQGAASHERTPRLGSQPAARRLQGPAMRLRAHGIAGYNKITFSSARILKGYPGQFEIDI